MLLSRCRVTENKSTMLRELVINNRERHQENIDFESISESELVKLAKTDSSAFGELYDRTYDRILNYIYLRTMNITLAEELTSNTYFKALRAFKRFRHDRPFITWLYKIATNEIRLYYRSSRRFIELDGIDNTYDEISRIHFHSNNNNGKSDFETDIQRYIDLHNILSKLPVKYQTVISLKYFEDMSLDEISDITGKRLGTVKSLLSRAIHRMRILMEQSAQYPSSNSNYDNSNRIREVDSP